MYRSRRKLWALYILGARSDDRLTTTLFPHSLFEPKFSCVLLVTGRISSFILVYIQIRSKNSCRKLVDLGARVGFLFIIIPHWAPDDGVFGSSSWLKHTRHWHTSAQTNTQQTRHVCDGEDMMKIVYLLLLRALVCRIGLYILVCRNCLMAARRSTTEAPITNHLKERKQGVAQMDIPRNQPAQQ